MSEMASQITSLTIVYSSVYSGTDQRKQQSSVSLAFVRGINRGPVNSPHKGPVTRKMFPFDDVIMSLFPSQFKFDENLVWFHLCYNTTLMMATKFSTWHDSWSLVVCIKLFCDLMAGNWITVNRAFHRLWNANKIISETGEDTMSIIVARKKIRHDPVGYWPSHVSGL